MRGVSWYQGIPFLGLPALYRKSLYIHSKNEYSCNISHVLRENLREKRVLCAAKLS